MGGQNTVSTAVPSLSNILSAVKGVGWRTWFRILLRVETTHELGPDFTWLNQFAATTFETFSRLVAELWEKKRLFFVFFWKFDQVNQSTLTWSMLTGGPSRYTGLTRRPKMVCWETQAIQRPIKAPFWLILTSFHSFLCLLTSKKFFGATCELNWFGFFTSVCYFSLFCT